MIKKTYAALESFELREGDEVVYLGASIDTSDSSIKIEAPEGEFWVWLSANKDVMTIDELIEGLTDLKKTLEG